MATVTYDAQDADVLHKSMCQALRYGDMLESMPRMVEDAIKFEIWKYRHCRGKGRPFLNLLEMMEHHEPDGVGVKRDRIEALIQKDPKVLAMWRNAITGPVGAHSDNVTMSKSERGNSKAYTVSRLERESPALFQAVCSGEMSANAAAIQAGIRKKPRRSFAAIKRDVLAAEDALSDAERNELINILQSGQ